MSSPKESSSVLRYILAGLKPLARMSLWIPVGVFGVITLSFWQYWTHPEWRGTSQGQTSDIEGEVGNNLDIGVNLNDIKSNLSSPSDLPKSPSDTTSSFANPFLPSSSTPAATDTPNGVASTTTPSNTLYPVGKSPTNPASGTQSQSFQIFPPLLPTVKNPGALFPSGWQNKSDRATSQSPSVDASQNLPQVNPLQQALERTQSEQTGVSAKNPTPSTNPYQTPTAPTQPSLSYPNAYGNQPISPQPIYPNAVPVQPYQTTYPNSYGGQSVPSQSPQVPNDANNYGIQTPQISDYEGLY